MSPDSVRLLNGSSLCSGRLEVKSNQSWSSVCEADSDQQDAEVVCKGSGCRSPSGLQWAPCGETEQQDAFCSEPNDVRLVGGASRCAGTLELKHRGEWRPVFGCDWILGDTADAVCERLHCGPLDYGGVMKSSHRSVWLIRPAQPGSALRECPTSEHSLFILKLTCSDLWVQTIISVSSMDGVSEAQQQGLQVSRGSSFTISCSIQPQYPGGSFQLTFTSSNTASSYTQPAVSHSAHFLFPAAEPAHQGNYSCVYHVHVSDHNFSSESRLLAVTVSDPTAHTVTAVVLLLILLSVIAALYFYWKASRGREPSRPESIELVSNDFCVCSAEGAQGAEEELPADHLTS